MAAELLNNGHRGKIILVDCNRNFASFGYEEQLQKLDKEHENLHYKQLATREGPTPCRIQKFIEEGGLEREFDLTISRDNSRIFLCGNPAMIGIPHYEKDGSYRFDENGGTTELFCNRYDLTIHHGHTPGEIYFEKYW